MKNIRDIYCENNFNLFVKYCDKRGFKTMEDLARLDFDLLKNEKGIGKIKLDSIIARYDAYFNNEKNSDMPIYLVADRAVRDYPVDMFFGGRHFCLFTKYCRENGIYTLGDLSKFDLNTLKNVKNFGGVYIEKIYKYWQENIKEKLEVAGETNVTVADENRELDIECLKAGGLSSRIIAQLKDAGAIKIGDVVNYNEFLTKCGLYLSKNCVRRLDTALEVFKHSPESIVRDCSEFVKANKFYKLYVKKAGGETLTAIGNEIGLSKERVRQMIKEVEKDLKNLLSIVVTFTLNDVPDKRMFRKSDIKYDFGIDSYVLDYAVKTGVYPKLKYISELDLYLVNIDAERFCDEIYEMLSVCIGDVEVMSVAKEKLKKELKSRGLVSITAESIIDYALKKAYALNGKFIYKKADARDYYAVCIKKYFPDGINIHQAEDLKRLKRYANETFGIEKYETNDRSLTVFLTRNLVLCDKGKYICTDDIYIDKKLLDDIKRYIITNSKSEFLYSEIYDRFKKQLAEKSSVTNKYYLHGVLKMYFKDEFTFTRDILRK